MNLFHVRTYRMTYNYYYKKNNAFFWRKIKNLVGHELCKETNKMICIHNDGSQTILSNWDKSDVRLKIDWVLFIKTQMEKESGKDIKLNMEKK